MELYVCIGSSCHLKGSYEIIGALKRLIAEHQLEEQVGLNASFCLGQCENGVTMKIDEQLVTGLNPQNVEQIFNDMVLKELQSR